MNLFNRLFIAVVAIIGLAFWTLVLLGALVSRGRPLINLADRLGTALGEQPIARLFVALVAAVFLLISLLLLLVEVLPGEERIPLRPVEGADASVTLSAVRQWIESEVERLRAIQRARAEVHARGLVVNVRLTARTTPDEPVPSKTAEVASTVRWVVEERLGLRLGKLEIQVAPQLRRVPLPPAAPRTAPPAPAPALPQQAAVPVEQPGTPPPV